MEKRLDIVIFGATGYTGKLVIQQVHKLGKNITWGVAGRNEPKLSYALAEAAKILEVKDFNDIPIIVAEVEDAQSIKKMCAQAKVILNCCGPYDLYAEVVVMSCIETKTHYLDISGESLFINKILQKYGEAAKEKGVYIVNACGFDSVVADLGICFLENNFSGTLNSVEVYKDFYEAVENIPGTSGNFSTWLSAINSIEKSPLLKKKVDPIKMPTLKPKLSIRFPYRVEGGWALLCPGTDDQTVRKSQYFFYEKNNKRPVQMYDYLVLHAFKYIFISLFMVLLVGIVAQFKFGRKILLKYPEFFTRGIISHKPPNEEKINQTRFSVVLKGEGWSKKLTKDENEYQTKPDKEIIGRVKGMRPSYHFSSLALTLGGLILLTESNNIPIQGGIVTPAMVFSKTSFVQQLQNNGVVFEIASIQNKT